MHNYIYNSDIGTFSIKEVEHGVYELWLEEEFLGDYGSPEMAAGDVANFNTDYAEWDRFKNELVNFPASLESWSKVEEETPQ